MKLKSGERNVSAIGHFLVRQHMAAHNGELWNGITHHLLHDTFGDSMRHVLGYGWVLTLTKENRNIYQRLRGAAIQDREA